MSFLSTLPARGATGKPTMKIYDLVISIHAPREGSDKGRAFLGSFAQTFLSTLPARGAT